MGNCCSHSAGGNGRPRRRQLPRKIKIRDRRRSSTQPLPRIRTSVSSSAQPRRSSIETISPRSIISDESIYYSDSEWQDGSPSHPHHQPHHQSHHHPRHDSDLLESAVEDFEGDEQTLVDKLAAWWHGFSLLGDGYDATSEDGVVIDDDGMMERVEEHQEQQRRLQPHRVTIVEDDDESLSASLSCVSFSKKKAPLRLSRVSLSKEENGSGASGAGVSGPTAPQSTTTPTLSNLLASSNPVNAPKEKRLAKAWARPDPKTFHVRSKNYMKDKVKLPAGCSLYRMVKVETVTFTSRKDHVAEHLELPQPSDGSIDAGKRVGLPPMLIIQLQMPMYTPVLFGDHDGESCSLIYYSELDPEVADMPQYAIDMAVRFVEAGTEEDGQATRDRLKLIPRIVNVEEWGREAGLSGTEVRLVNNYNGKPLLMRPQFSCHKDSATDPSYFEVDVDIHNYAYVARRAFCGYVPRLGPSVFENGFVIQGNNEHELPEVLLTASRVYRMDFRRAPRMSL